jgi:DNA-binding XRE family transcriptional regulator
MAVIRKPYGPPESEVCERLAAARRLRNLSQENLAETLGLTRVQLGNIETARTILRFDIGWQACKHLNLNQWHLATGEGRMQPFYDIDVASLKSELGPDSSFRVACGYVRSDLEMARAADSGDGRTLSSVYSQSIVSIIRSAIAKAPSSTRSELLDYLENMLRQLREKQSPKKRVLTDSESESRSKEVKPILPGLLARLRKATEEPGKKSELAKFLDAPLASVSRWLSADPKVQREPGGEIALKMLHWVEAQEHKQQ